MTLRDAVKGEIEGIYSICKNISKDYLFEVLNGVEDPTPIPGDSHPVLNYHGFLSSHRSMVGVARAQKEAGFTPFLRGYAFWDCLEEVGLRRSKKMNEFCQRTGRKVSMVGHSEGGLIALMKAQNHPELVDKVIMLGTPFRGTPAAYLPYFVKSCKQMVPGNPFLQMLDERGFPESVEFHCVATPYDEIVFPLSASLLPADKYPNVHNHIVENVAHAGLIGPRCYDLINDILLGNL